MKELDRDDIESLGFNDYKHAVGDWYKLKLQRQSPTSYYDFRSYRLIHWYKEKAVTIKGYEYDWNDDGSEETLFQGKCNSLEELQHILKLINITD